MGDAAADDGGGPAIVFAGGGAGAALAAIALLRATTWLRLAYRIVLIDDYGRFARGRPYGGAGDDCLLEVPVKHMSALPDRPCHLLEWARARSSSRRRTSGAAPALSTTAPASAACGPDTLLPRRVYGDYLAETLAATADWASPYASLHTRTDRVVGVGADDRDGGAKVHLASGAGVAAAAAVVATGDPAAAAPPPVGGGAPEAQAPGLSVCSCGALTTPQGEAARLFAVGTVRRGAADATVPRIRDQAEAMAQRIADTVLRTPPGRR
ncbi:FAD/NAD(P)-binding protein [Streptomonospora salina]|uniref:Putative NAD(P)/FAD-binding protein YdhS n=1 Tax=Streptomonospora salina TaxID=104205 RepID=A0A841EP15_9ACTN|nr:FAD/NAD(P)-binding protein [Streptomonospora salina]MBB6001161.1 putative NAD(P)/FAD-binding protein YdhS [Streptomonospora salina]